MSKTATVEITVVIDGDANECLYENGKVWSHQRESMIYVCDLVEQAKGRLIDLKHVSIEFVHDEWPDCLSDAIDPKFELSIKG